MSSSLDSIPQAVATIVSAYVNVIGQGAPVGFRDDIEKRIVQQLEQDLIRAPRDLVVAEDGRIDGLICGLGHRAKRCPPATATPPYFWPDYRYLRAPLITLDSTQEIVVVFS